MLNWVLETWGDFLLRDILKLERLRGHRIAQFTRLFSPDLDVNCFNIECYANLEIISVKTIEVN